ncbi:putative MFS multidrug transporter [Polychaeton citri CBS 116435]|uniref:MFS multidrug transporter n=1 Tax=Polychaeton citri CBS 116435 TaxID=1314669 RepID=A0A9P4Q9G8_9PEZI|nr:putative MFS multidrug transporter [Polychaeton citri CBS 116435]
MERPPPSIAKETIKGKEGDTTYPSGPRFVILMISIMLGTFMVSLDKLIVSTAIPQITNDFDSADDIGWYGTAYLLTNATFQLVFGKLYKFLPVKTTFLVSTMLFEAGSALCGAAPNSISFILGRAISGLGAGGVLSGVMVILVYCVPLHKRPRYQGFSGAVFGASSVLGPTVSGAFTTHVTWRWCFYINLPIGGVVMLLVFFLLHVPDRPSTQIPLIAKLRQLNALGLLALAPGVICLCLALQWGGTTYAWNNGRVIALLVLAFTLLTSFAVIQVWRPKTAMLPPTILVQRSIASGFWVSMCIGAHQTVFLYYLPLWFQAIKGKSAVDSGVYLLPMVLLIVAGFLSNGELVTRMGYYTPSLIFGTCLTAIGAGLLTTFGVHTTEGEWIGYQIVYGFGVGFASQVPNMAAQTVLAKEDVAIGASFMFFGQTLFAAIFTSVGQNVLSNHLAKCLATIPGIPSQLFQATGTTHLLDLIPAQYHTAALTAYNESLRSVFQIGLCMACIAILGGVCMEWHTVKKKFAPKNGGSGSGSEQNEKGATSYNGQGEKEASDDKVKAETGAVAVTSIDETKKTRPAAAESPVNTGSAEDIASHEHERKSPSG